MNFTILGNLPRKSNSRQVFKNRRTGNIIFAKSATALDYTDSFLLQTKNVDKSLFQSSRPLKLTAKIYYQSKLSDLSDELLCDLMQKSGIIFNDRLIKEKHLYCYLDKINPRCEVEIEEIIGDDS